MKWLLILLVLSTGFCLAKSKVLNEFTHEGKNESESRRRGEEVFQKDATKGERSSSQGGYIAKQRWGRALTECDLHTTKGERSEPVSGDKDEENAEACGENGSDKEHANGSLDQELLYVWLADVDGLEWRRL